MALNSIAGSFRDPSGHLFTYNGDIYRYVSDRYRKTYDLATTSGFFSAVAEEDMLIRHREIPSSRIRDGAGAYRILLPDQIPFISYPYEWCFSQLKDAALLTIRLQRRAMVFGLSLKDASAYNVQFRGGKPVFIDTLSFEPYAEGRPWVAYRQFCQHFLAPLALMAYVHVDLIRLLSSNLDGVPLPVAGKLLPASTRFRTSLLAHIHLHGRAQQIHADGAKSARRARNARVSRTGLLGLLASLESGIRKLEWMPTGTAWGDYYQDTNYTNEAQEHKKHLIRECIAEVDPSSVWDLGGNTGLFSRVASDMGIQTVAFDIDQAAVEKNYRTARDRGEENLLPLVMDLGNPSSDLGWDQRERMSLERRGPADMVLALALVHHLAIGNNVPLERIAQMLSRLGRNLIVEFVPKQDSQVQRLLLTREDIFPEYTWAGFEAAMGRRFELVTREHVRGSERVICLYRRR